MSMAARGNPNFKKGGNSGFNPNPRGRGTWRGGPPNFSQPNHGNPANRNAGGPGPNQQGFQNGSNHPPLHHGLNSTIIVITRDNVRHRGVLASIDNDGFVLRNYRKLTNSPPGPSSLPSDAVQRFSRGSLLNWHRADGPMSPSTSGTPTGGSAGPPSTVSSPRPGFLTDQDISQNRSRAERDLTPWNDGSASGSQGSHTLLSSVSSMKSDETTFGSSAAGKWDQFAANESMFGVTTDYNEELYTTKIDTSRPDFHEKQRQAAQMAKEIEKSTTANVHQAEERNQVDDSGANEEDKYGAVQRSANAYVPPGARGPQDNVKLPVPAPAARTTNSAASTSVTVNLPESAKADTGSKPPASAPKKDAVGSFHDFISAEKQRMQEKKQQIVKKEKDQKIADLLKFSQAFKLKSVIPSDLVSILAKTEDKQKELIAKTKKDADSSDARVIQKHVAVAAPFIPKPVDPPPVRRPFKQESSAQGPSVTIDPPSAAAKQAMRNHVPGSGPSVIPRTGTKMVLQAIPPFRGKPLAPKTEDAPSANGTSSQVSVTAESPAPAIPNGSSKVSDSAPSIDSNSTAATKLSAKAMSFRPNPNALSFKPGVTSPPGRPTPQLKPEAPVKAESIPPKSHPFFGHAKIIPSPVPIKEEFNPFKTAKVAEASQAAHVWGFTGKPFVKTFPPLPPMPSPRPQPQQPFVEDPGASARNQYQYVYPHFSFGPQPGQIPMMNVPQNMPGGGFPPAHFAPPGQFHPQQPGGSPVPFHPQMQHGMPPGPGFMPQGPHFPPHANGGPRSNMGSPMPQNAYYQSPQMTHAIAQSPGYPMMMGQQPPPPGQQQQHPPHQQAGGPFHFDNQHAPHAGMMSPRQAGATPGPNPGPNMR